MTLETTLCTSPILSLLFNRVCSYYNDVWVFHLDELRWESVGDPRAQAPSKRGGCRALVHGDHLYVYGGYSKIRDEEDKEIEHGRIVDDMWRLSLSNYKVVCNPGCNVLSVCQVGKGEEEWNCPWLAFWIQHVHASASSHLLWRCNRQ